MEKEDNKKLVGADYKINGPKKNYYYYREKDEEVIKDELDVLASLLHAEKITIEVSNHTEAWIKYNAQKKSLDYSGLKILMYFPKHVSKVHFGGKYYGK